MRPGLAWLLLAQSAGERWLAAQPLPGPVLAPLPMLVVAALRRWCTTTRAAADALLAHLSLLFVPVGGVMTHAGLLTQYGARMPW